jgi:tripartite-type tricarboxylate transporter receptor subunit TctC
MARDVMAVLSAVVSNHGSINLETKKMKKLIGCLIAICCTITSLNAAGDAPTDYPSRPIRLVVPFPAGGTPDMLARILGQELTARWGQPTVVENKPGAAGIIATEHVARATPDGYTCLLASSSTLTVSPHLYKNLSYNVTTDLKPVTQIATTPLLLVTNPGFEARSVQELIRLAKSKPGAINYASAGVGTPHHLSMVLLQRSTGIEMTHVSYKGTSPAMVDLMGGQVSVMFETVQGALSNVQTGKVRAIAVSGTKRLANMPETPTVSEAGVKGFDVNAWYGIVCPGNTPQAIVDKLEKEISAILKMKTVTDQLARQSLTPVGNSAAEFAKIIEVQSASWGKIIKETKMEIN